MLVAQREWRWEEAMSVILVWRRRRRTALGMTLAHEKSGSLSGQIETKISSPYRPIPIFLKAFWAHN